MKAPTRRGPAPQPPPVEQRFWGTAGRPLTLTPGSAVCLRCGWLATAQEDAAPAARSHTETTTHPTVYRQAAADREQPVGRS